MDEGTREMSEGKGIGTRDMSGEKGRRKKKEEEKSVKRKEEEKEERKGRWNKGERRKLIDEGR